MHNNIPDTVKVKLNYTDDTSLQNYKNKVFTINLDKYNANSIATVAVQI